MGKGGLRLRFHNLHLPDDVRVFSVTAEGVRRWDRQVVVFDVALTGERVLRHYAFADRWFEINCSLDRSARPVEDGDPFPFAFNCDVCTPLIQDGDGIYNVDLELDVLVSADGRRYRVKDEEEFLAAARKGWLDRRERLGALHGLGELLRLLDRAEFLPFLHAVCPFEPFRSCHLQPPAERVGIDQAPLFHRIRRRA